MLETPVLKHMRVTYEAANGITKARLSDNPDHLCPVAELIEGGFGGRWIQKLNGLDQSYWDYSLNGIMLTLHREHYLGISLFPARGETDLKRAK
jgi:hypothetical protein